MMTAAGFSPPPNVTAPGGMDNPMGGPNMGQPGPQQFGYGGNYGEITEPGTKQRSVALWWPDSALQGPHQMVDLTRFVAENKPGFVL